MAAGEYKVQLMLVTPEQAERWLKETNRRNRRMNRRVVDRLVRDIKAGRWVVTHQGIAFDEHDMLLDGQNRLQAIVIAGIAVEMYVSFNVARKAMLCMDTGKPRSLAASALFNEQVDVDEKHASVAKAMINPKQKTDLRSSQEEVAFLMKHYAAIDWTCNLFPKHIRRISTQALKAVIARAFYSQDHERLEKFALVMSTGSQAKRDSAGVKLREKMMNRDFGATQGRRNIYKAIEWCLERFLAYDEDVTRIGYAPDELFLLPEEHQGLKSVKNGKPVHKPRLAG